MWTILLAVFTLIASLVLAIALPVMFASSINRLRKERSLLPLLKPLSIVGGLSVGVAVAWSMIVILYEWPLSFRETFYATVHSDIYCELESAAEDYVFFMLLLGNLGAILAAVSGRPIARSRRRISLTH